MSSIWLNRFAKLVSAATFVLILAGGLVTSTGSGLSVPDWPLSYGQFFPPMIGGIRFEHTHRVIAGLVGFLTLALMIWLFAKEERKWVRMFGLSAFFAIIFQAVLGGLTVIYLLPTFVSVFHACLAQTFFCLVVAIAFFTSKEWCETSPVDSENAKGLHCLLIATTTFVYLQLILGAVARHTSGRGITLHFLNAFLVFVNVLLLMLFVASKFADEKKLLRPAFFLGGLVVIQIFLGFGAFIFKLRLDKAMEPRLAEVIFTAAHQTVGALVLVTSFFLTLRSLRLFKVPSQELIAGKVESL